MGGPFPGAYVSGGGGGVVNLDGTGSANEVAFFVDADTLAGDSNFTWTAANGLNLGKPLTIAMDPPSLTLEDTGGTLDGIVKVDGGFMYLQEGGDSDGDILTLDLTNAEVLLKNRLEIYPNVGNTRAFYIGAPSTNTQGAYIEFQSNIGAGTKSGSFQLDNSGNIVFRSNDNAMYFDFYDNAYWRDSSAGYAQRMRLNASGYVGINGDATSQFQVTSSGAAVIGQIIQVAASASANALEGQDSTGTAKFWGYAQTDANDSMGPSLAVGRNASSDTEGPAAGTLHLTGADGTDYYLWVDATGDLRIHTAAPTGSSGSPTVSDTAGTVVGAQS